MTPAPDELRAEQRLRTLFAELKAERKPYRSALLVGSTLSLSFISLSLLSLSLFYLSLIFVTTLHTHTHTHARMFLRDTLLMATAMATTPRRGLCLEQVQELGQGTSLSLSLSLSLLSLSLSFISLSLLSLLYVDAEPYCARAYIRIGEKELRRCLKREFGFRLTEDEAGAVFR